MVQSPNSSNSWAWARAEPGAESSTQVSLVGGRGPRSLEPSPLPPEVCTSRKPESGAGYPIKSRHCDREEVSQPPGSMPARSPLQVLGGCLVGQRSSGTGPCTRQGIRLICYCVLKAGPLGAPLPYLGTWGREPFAAVGEGRDWHVPHRKCLAQSSLCQKWLRNLGKGEVQGHLQAGGIRGCLLKTRLLGV